MQPGKLQPGEVVVDSIIRDDLNQFARMVWDTPEDISKSHPQGFEYIDLRGCLAGFEDIFGGTIEEKILVRDEYRIAAQELQTARYHRGAYVTGQPGIGKSLFLVYLLVQLLRQGCKVAVHDSSHQYYVVFTFEELVAFYPLTYKTPLATGGSMWALSDSSLEHNGAPPACFFASPKRIRLIQATSPEKQRWHEWSKQAKAECYVMDIWTAQEIANFATLLDHDVQRMVDLEKKWGGVPRILMTYLQKSDQQIENWYHHRAKVAIRKCQNMVQSIVDKSLSEGLEAPSQFYFCRPADYATSSIDRTEICATVPTHTICNILGRALQELSIAIRLEFFTALSQLSDTRQAAGFIRQALWDH
ncbi:hypothetical protein EV363DRAFT_87913 [Boletus edulis]|nr:hypothetical protein EV363DRAFT_87913 [Boletus edulis]